MRSRNRINLFLTALLGFSTSASAQITEGSEVFGGGSLGELFLSFIDPVTFVEIDTIAQAGMFLAVLGVFYFAEKNLLEQVFVRLEEIIMDSMGGNSIRGRGRDEYPTGAKGMAFSIAFLSANGFTGFIGLSIAKLIGLLALGAILIIILKIFNAGAGNPAGKTASAASSAAGSAAGSSATAAGNALDKARNILSNAGNEAQDAADTGNEKEGLDAEEKIQQALEILNNAEGNIAKEFSSDRQELEQAIKEFNDVYKYKKEEDQELHSGELQSRMDQARANLQLYIEALESGNVRNAKDKLDEAVKDFQFLVKMFTNMDEDLSKEVPEDKDALNKVIDAADRALQSHQEVQLLIESLKKAEKEDEYLEKFAESRGFKKMYERAEKEEKEEKQLENKLEQLEMEDGKLLKELKKADEILQEHIKMDEDILKTLNKEVNQSSVFGEDNLANNINQAMKYIEENNTDTKFWEETEAELMKCKRGMEALRNHAQHIEEIKQNEDKKERKVADNLEEHIKAMSN